MHLTYSMGNNFKPTNYIVTLVFQIMINSVLFLEMVGYIITFILFSAVMYYCPHLNISCHANKCILRCMRFTG